MNVKPNGTIAAETVPKAVETEIEWLIDRRDGAPNFELRKFRIRPNGSIPKHYHSDVEHEQYVLKGEYVVGIGEKEYHVKRGDSLFIPAGTLHWYDNSGSEDAEFLCIIPKKENYQAIYVDEKEGAAQAVSSGSRSKTPSDIDLKKEC
jgi:quercetin dioxygenase-like cupin family protein